MGALYANTSGANNTASGAGALNGNQTGSGNTASGFSALQTNSGGHNNTATGADTLYSNTIGDLNTATGYSALYTNFSGNYNTATGARALFNNTGNDNTASGFEALVANTTGSENTATGKHALFYNSTGNYNTASGVDSLSYNTGNNNTALGHIALGYSNGDNNIALGGNSGTNLLAGSNNIYIGSAGGGSNESGKIRIGTKGTHTGTFVAGIFNKTVSNSTPVFINANDQLGTVHSSARFKQDIQPMDEASDAILALKPVTFHYKEELDPDKIAQFGLIAEEVEKVAPDLVVRDDEGNLMTVRYEAVNAMLLNEFLKEHQKVEEQQADIAKLKSANAQQQKQIEALAAGLQKVSHQIELNKPAPRVAETD